MKTINELLHSTETYLVERTTSTGNMDKFCEANCAFAKDLPNSRQKGYLIIGANDEGSLSGLKVDDSLLKKFLQSFPSNILTIPVMSVELFVFPEGDLLVAEVSSLLLPPVGYAKRIATCGDFAEMDTCPKLSMVAENNSQAINNLKHN